MKKPKFKISDLIFVIFIALLLIPQTRNPIQVALNKLKVAVWSPSMQNLEDQKQVRPFQYAVRNLNGVPKTIPIGQGKLTFLSYWATWCAPCIAELPGIQQLYTDYGDKVNFVLLSQEDREVVQRFLIKKGYDLPVYSPQMKAPDLLQETSIPTNYIIDAQGNILIKETGAADWNSGKVRAILDGLLLEKDDAVKRHELPSNSFRMYITKVSQTPNHPTYTELMSRYTTYPFKKSELFYVCRVEGPIKSLSFESKTNFLPPFRQYH